MDQDEGEQASVRDSPAGVAAPGGSRCRAAPAAEAATYAIIRSGSDSVDTTCGRSRRPGPPPSRRVELDHASCACRRVGGLTREHLFRRSRCARPGGRPRLPGRNDLCTRPEAAIRASASGWHGRRDAGIPHRDRRAAGSIRPGPAEGAEIVVDRIAPRRKSILTTNTRRAPVRSRDPTGSLRQTDGAAPTPDRDRGCRRARTPAGERLRISMPAAPARLARRSATRHDGRARWPALVINYDSRHGRSIILGKSSLYQ